MAARTLAETSTKLPSTRAGHNIVPGRLTVFDCSDSHRVNNEHDYGYLFDDFSHWLILVIKHDNSAKYHVPGFQPAAA
jgi:hypothetical protein